jgi:hypothetical protein
MRSLVALALLLALGVSSVALAGRGDPQERLTPRDQARARSMLIRQADVGLFQAIPTADNPATPYCTALDESDLTLTGRANSPSFTAGSEFVVSRAYVYESRADANASWKRGTSSAGQSCLRQLMRAELSGTPVRLVLFKKLAFPKLPVRSVAYRIVASRNGIRLYLDLIALHQARAQVSIVYGAVVTLPPTSEEVRLAKLVARRMTNAMRG